MHGRQGSNVEGWTQIIINEPEDSSKRTVDSTAMPSIAVSKWVVGVSVMWQVFFMYIYYYRISLSSSQSRSLSISGGSDENAILPTTMQAKIRCALANVTTPMAAAIQSSVAPGTKETLPSSPSNLSQPPSGLILTSYLSF